MATETFGSSVNEVYIKQINERQNALGSNNKTRDQIEFINSNAAWVKLRSSVNKISRKEAQKLLDDKGPKEGIGDSLVAQNYVLLGGTLNPKSRTPRSGILRSPTSDNPDAEGRPAALNRDTEAYLNYESTGFRPMPGITQFNVESKNTYGTLMQATVNFTIWSREQLENAELLFFRPGYTALLEWGHSVFLNNRGEKVIASEASTIPEGLFFKEFQQVDEIDKQIEARRDKYEGNYEGMFGFITNFDWSFRPDGGYDCSVKIVSRGIVLQSIKNSAVSDNADEDEQTDETKNKSEKTLEEYKSTLHFLFERLEQYSEDELKFNGTKFLEEKNTNATKVARKLKTAIEKNKKLIGYGSDEIDFNVYQMKIKSKDDDSFFSSLLVWLNSRKSLGYIKMRTFLNMLNAFEILKDPSGDGKHICPFSLEYGEKYKTFPSHFSCEPLIALIPRVPELYPDFVVGKKDGTSINQEMQTDVKQTQGGIEDIQNIMISSGFLADKISGIIEGAQEQGVGIFDFVKAVLAGINTALVITNLDVFYDSTKNVYKIIDRGNPAKPSLNAQVINVTGLKNTVVELNVQSTVSQNISSQISIAAQGHTGNYGENLRSMLQWNAGAIDRHIVSKEQSEDGSTGDPNKGKEKVKEAIQKAFDSLNKDRVVFGNVNIELWGQVKTEGKNWVLNEYHNSQPKGKDFEPMPVPVELSIKLLGISGLKIGQTFRINKQVLPRKYDRFAYIITGLSQEIGTDNKWYTTVKTQFYAAGL
tara:strand:- start:332 stop:2608 length:2277 start_codon:yes stop_codon:yes gene_type:complete